jgi:hypothetical protein
MCGTTLTNYPNHNTHTVQPTYNGSSTNTTASWLVNVLLQ